MIDLHIHTNCSDGQFSPAETMQMARDAGVTVASVTDHDTAAGISEAARAAKAYGIAFFPGIEISVQDDREMHLLGYGIDPKNPKLLAFCEKNNQDREIRSKKMLAFLQDLGLDLTMEEVRQWNDGKATGKPHFARAIVKKGYAGSVQEAFERYLTTPEYAAKVERPKPLPEVGIRVILDAGGIPVLAHPHQLQLPNEALEEKLCQLKEMGLQGIEAYYAKHTKAETAFYLQLAEKYQLLYTCGSDFHGAGVKPEIFLGTGIRDSLCITDSAIPRRLRQAISQRIG